MANLQNGTKHVFGTVRVGEKGQIVLPKACRDVFNIKPGDVLVVLGDETQGIALIEQDKLLEFARAVFEAPAQEDDKK